jgi:hypothetical protein
MTGSRSGPSRPSRPHVLFHPDYTVGPGVPPDLLTFRRRKRSRAITAGGELHPALRAFIAYSAVLRPSIQNLCWGRKAFPERPIETASGRLGDSSRSILRQHAGFLKYPKEKATGAAEAIRSGWRRSQPPFRAVAVPAR